MPFPRRTRIPVVLAAVAVTLVGCGAVDTPAASPSARHAASPKHTTTASADPTPSETATPAPASVSTPQVVVTIGDSIMAAQGLDTDEGWPELLATGTPSTLVNLACSGAGFIAVGTCGTNYAGLIDQAAHAQPTLVIVESSSNDMGQSDDAIDEATSDTMATLRTAVPGATIVALSTVWNEQASPPEEVASSSTAIQRAAAAEHAIYLNLGQPLEGHPEWMQSDDVHPTADGQRVLAETVRTQLAAVGIAF
ncbi:SGNH/GDSL hydrolase family protein [Microbacterium sp. ASV49]|uniref:GDSL-type esterase/lipase family protein n=1 Tax=Microbacterium candidum TaxID=3041922 RepID=A0ABT7N009_9MICO|nr:GDSL-type esterase/lipase family protein [Microbacterium sp. ASV49]MDL9979995.1 GDSL-type esterase/lipase family protein [Microbacterium sp. ASV49]